ncbi:hypothetical protein H0H92_008312 [Tricholoma furcatifolium]|nr:hypothetical protein H0H92_008312 [Tricholoma furcatifolium]
MLNDSTIPTQVPFMVLVLTETGSESGRDFVAKLGIGGRITPRAPSRPDSDGSAYEGEGRPTALFVASLPLNKGYQEGKLRKLTEVWTPKQYHPSLVAVAEIRKVQLRFCGFQTLMRGLGLVAA